MVKKGKIGKTAEGFFIIAGIKKGFSTKADAEKFKKTLKLKRGFK